MSWAVGRKVLKGTNRITNTKHPLKEREEEKEREDETIVEGAFQCLPDETLLWIFFFVALDSQSRLLALSRVSQRWRRLVVDPSLWHNRTIKLGITLFFLLLLESTSILNKQSA